MSDKENQLIGYVYNMVGHALMYLQEGEYGNAATGLRDALKKIQLYRDSSGGARSVFSVAIEEFIGTISDDAYHLVIDLETLGLAQDSRVMAIGAVFGSFNKTTPASFYQNIAIDDKLQNNRSIDASTVKWWFEREGSVREALLLEPVDTIKALSLFNEFVRKCIQGFGITDSKRIYVWGKGVDFDNSILLSLYDDIISSNAVGLTIPFNFRQNMDARTFYNIMMKSDETKAHIVLPHNSHYALDDAKACFSTLRNFFTGKTE